MEISPAAEQIFNIAGFPITNSLILTWLTMGLLISIGALSTYKLQLVPGGLQNVIEVLIEKFYDFVKDVIGTDRDTEKVFPIAFTFFAFILLSNWLGLIPGIGSIGIYEFTEPESPLHAARTLHFFPFLRAPGADLNTTLAFAVISVIITHILGVSAVGFFKYAERFISFRNPLAFFIGILELISEIAKIISFSFRLFGNIFAGEVLLIVIGTLVPYIAPLPFLALEIFVGFIQALIFTMLTLVFIKVAIEEHD